eukprot:1425930-Amphidinium_carterae.1
MQSMRILLHCCEHYFAISPEGLRGILEGRPPLLHRCENNLAISPEGLRGMLESKRIILHCCKHYLAVSPEGLHGILEGPPGPPYCLLLRAQSRDPPSALRQQNGGLARLAARLPRPLR